jgi:hypothetical protein
VSAISFTFFIEGQLLAEVLFDLRHQFLAAGSSAASAH